MDIDLYNTYRILIMKMAIIMTLMMMMMIMIMMMIITVTQSVFKLGPPILHGSRSR